MGAPELESPARLTPDSLVGPRAGFVPRISRWPIGELGFVRAVFTRHWLPVLVRSASLHRGRSDPMVHQFGTLCPIAQIGLFHRTDHRFPLPSIRNTLPNPFKLGFVRADGRRGWVRFAHSAWAARGGWVRFRSLGVRASDHCMHHGLVIVKIV
jgi:hypothetical protein